MALTVKQVENIKASEKDFKKADSGGLYLLIKPNGAKYWRLAYRFSGKQKTLALGVYPTVGLADARFKANEAKSLIKNGIDPSYEKKNSKFHSDLENSSTFKYVANEWFQKKSNTWVERHILDVKRRLEVNIYPHIGHLQISQISAVQVLNAIRLIEKRNTIDLAHRVMGVCSQVFKYGVATSRCDSDPTRDLKGALTPHVKKNQNAIKPEELPKLLADISGYSDVGQLQTQLGLQLMLHVFVRTSELIKAKWNEFDFDKAVWVISADRTKKKREHLVPLTPQSIEILQQLKVISQGSEYVFAGRDTKKHISNNTLLFALYRLGYKGKMSGHGFRSVASTILNEHEFSPDVIEVQLSHIDTKSVRLTCSPFALPIKS